MKKQNAWTCPACGIIHKGFKIDQCRNEKCSDYFLLKKTGTTPARENNRPVITPVNTTQNELFQSRDFQKFFQRSS